MNTKPIIFSIDMVRALVEGRKSMTRRVIKNQPDTRHGRIDYENGVLKESSKISGCWHVNRQQTCPHGQKNSYLWVRETYKYWDWTDDGIPWIKYAANNETIFHSCIPETWCEKLVDIWADLSIPENYNIDNAARDHKWRSPIYCPRWASRLTLKITDIRVERVQDISEEDAKAEGVHDDDFYLEGEHDWNLCPKCGGTKLYNGFGESLGVIPDLDCYECDTYKKRFKHLWNSLDKKGEHSWESNPWIWVIEFELIKANIDQVLSTEVEV